MGAKESQEMRKALALVEKGVSVLDAAKITGTNKGSIYNKRAKLKREAKNKSGGGG